MAVLRDNPLYRSAVVRTLFPDRDDTRRRLSVPSFPAYPAGMGTLARLGYGLSGWTFPKKLYRAEQKKKHITR